MTSKDQPEPDSDDGPGDRPVTICLGCMSSPQNHHYGVKRRGCTCDCWRRHPPAPPGPPEAA